MPLLRHTVVCQRPRNKKYARVHQCVLFTRPVKVITAQLMSEVCPNVASEPTLQPVTNEHFFHRSANTESGARLDVRAQGFWGVHHQQAYFDVRVFNPLAISNRQTTISTCFRSHDREKR